MGEPIHSFFPKIGNDLSVAKNIQKNHLIVSLVVLSDFKQLATLPHWSLGTNLVLITSTTLVVITTSMVVTTTSTLVLVCISLVSPVEQALQSIFKLFSTRLKMTK